MWAPVNITFFCPIDLDNVRLNSQLVNDMQLLNQLLAIGKIRMVNLTMAELICQKFGVQLTPDYPLAALTAHSSFDANNHYYLQADPVHLILQRDAVALSDPATLLIAEEELQTLCDVLNQHFFEDDFTFELSHGAKNTAEPSTAKLSQAKLLLRLNTPPKITTTLPEKVIARNVYDYLPQGDDASYWNKITNEIQMLLHEHPINQQRELKHLPAINSVWLSGGGLLPDLPITMFSQVISDVSYVQTLARLVKVECGLMSNYIKFELNQQVFIALTPNSDIKHWLEILYKLVQQGATLQLNLAHQDAVLVCDIKPRDLYKAWLFKWLGKEKPVLSYFQAYYQAGVA